MPLRHALITLIIGLFLYACSDPEAHRSEHPDWDHLNYLAVACDQAKQHPEQGTPHACKPGADDDALSAIGRRGGRGR